jgi:hypothetical protein
MLGGECIEGRRRTKQSCVFHSLNRQHGKCVLSDLSYDFDVGTRFRILSTNVTTNHDSEPRHFLFFGFDVNIVSNSVRIQHDRVISPRNDIVVVKRHVKVVKGKFGIPTCPRSPSSILNER